MSAADPDLAVEVTGLRKRFRGTTALAGVDLEVRAGTVLGLLGPNGAGKTTLVRILATLLVPDGGRAVVAGHDVERAPHAVRSSIALAGQHAGVDGALTGRENLVMLGRLLHLGRRGAAARARDLLTRFDLVAAADRPAAGYSGGMRRRLDLACCLVARPGVLFLDEPTTGLDPASRAALWDAVRGLVRDGVTVLLTTQYLEEADQLADRVAVVAAGRVLAGGTPAELKAQAGTARAEVVVGPQDLATAVRALTGPGGPPAADTGTGAVSVPLPGGAAQVSEVVLALSAAGVPLVDLSVRRPTLDDAFLRLVSRPRALADGRGRRPDTGERSADDPLHRR
ncbi:ATP-binding cassette domain-containing protein [Actinokineospora bangkokensis]|uniref:Daunorubicin/doxorubicin resistance ABC transporter ATP-binding protein DrrA n=1 Tax=Actinokineospora bangkokensis TaxID=1193682 RepID=A0A1Q9LIW3_9PSEU|nr:ATP-binding cassette domain-containing protein [Actinokineospora bangkokensis]OLR91940.1 daunorubicin/doxorubicin resistance ABC transporter ATP-binding protein DrrA [Actinokineospora bangkokensis]